MHLVADIGGTHARFALADPVSGVLRAPRVLAVAEHPDIATAIRSYLDATEAPREGAVVQWAALAVAAPVRGPRIEFTNSHWGFDREGLREVLGLERLAVLNDFEALARAVPVLPPDTVRVLKEGRADPAAPRAVLGPGTGLGVAGVLPGVGDVPRDAVQVLASQGGHVGFAPADEVEVELLRFMQAQLGVVTAEDLISGRGLVQLYRFFAGRSAAPAASLTPAEVGAHAVAGDDAAAVEAVLRFWALLGGFAADVALLYGAWGGVYVGGGIAPRLLALFERSDFSARFTARPAMAEVLAPVPIWLIDDPHAALRGAAAVLRSPGFK